MVFDYPEQTNGVGGSYSWTGEFSGNMTTTALEESKSLKQDLTLVTPGGERYPKVYWDFEPTESGGTKVTWGMTGEHTLLDKLYFAFSGYDFDQEQHKMNNAGFDGLDILLKEEMNKYEVSDPKIVEFGGGFYLYITSSTTPANMQPTMAKNYGTISGFMAQNQVAMNGRPFTIYEVFNDNGGVIMSNAIPVKNRITVIGETNILCDYQKPSKAVLTVLNGNYDNLDKAWDAAQKYLVEQGLEASSQKPFEIYANDPGEFPNPANWITEVYIPIK